MITFASGGEVTRWTTIPSSGPFVGREADSNMRNRKMLVPAWHWAFYITCLYRIALLLIPGTPGLEQLGTRDGSPRLTRISSPLAS
jgi:hypothetical protein